ncbi:histone deacetylase [Leptolyngbya sp. PCC 6406]|uniref:histone deacetylase family protein n=1 Tax=Leptolyngbya sp. PCC 6406 TaxID=1173264 RepID=UPI0002AC5FC0|nr:histone deacetylase [Leptolyngbya sp. PCC 6406]
MPPTLSVFYSDVFLEHDTGSFHPENPGRLTAVVQALQAAPFASQLRWRLPPRLQDRDPLPAIRYLHSLHYISDVEHLAETGGGSLDPDTPVSPRSYEVALLAVNGWLAAVDQVVMTGEPAFVLARPPGHHALSDRAMGFCIFANAAITAHYALAQAGIERVAILDWDVHHGNGTQALVQNNPAIAYCSLHQFPAYPGTGAARDRGPHGTVLNLPMAPGSTVTEYQAAFDTAVIPFLQSFQPDLLIISAGYDATQADPLASIALQPQDYGLFTRLCQNVQPRIMFGLEGGYDYSALAQSIVATIGACLEDY